MNKKILASLIIIGILGFALGWGTYSYFSDTGYSYNNTFQAGTLNLQLEDADESYADNVYYTWNSPSNWAPGETVFAELNMTNVGSVGAKLVGIRGVDLEDGGLADVVLITEVWYSEGDPPVQYNVTDYYIGVFDADGDGNLTLREFVTSPHSMLFWEGGWPPTADYLKPDGANYQIFKLEFTFAPWAGNDYQGKWARFDLRVVAFQTHLQVTLLGKGDSCYGYGEA